MDGTDAITINSDLGESLGNHSFGNDEGLLGLIDVANVACGFHAGDPSGMQETVDRAVAAGVPVGAHPGLPDLVGFGRREMVLTAEEVRSLVLYQVGALKAFLDLAGSTLSHIKPHGSLYGMAARSEGVMDAICDVAELYGVPVYGLADTSHERVALRRRLSFVSELYVDLDYRDDGSLIISRSPPLMPVERAKSRVRTAMTEGTISSDMNRPLRVRFDSICIHSDTKNAVDIATAVRGVLSARQQSA